jgi:hypothetical protein
VHTVIVVIPFCQLTFHNFKNLNKIRSRNSFLTGIYAEHTGLNHDVIYAADPYGLPSNFKLFPQYLEPHGYKSHIVGKYII